MNQPLIYMCPHPDPPSHFPPHPITLGISSASSLSTCLMHPTWSGDPFKMLSRLVITFLPRSKCLLISRLQSPSAVILEPRKIKSATVSPSNCHKGMDHWKSKVSRKTYISALLTMPRPLTVWITINCRKFFKRWEYKTTWPASWETCMQARKQQLELGMEQQTGSK